jgi:RNA polymerase sigma-70 factor (ECF subfamily)
VDDPDPATIRAAVAGDLHAFEQIVRCCQGPVWRYLRRFVGDDALAEDLTQETFIRVYRRLDTYRFGSRFTTWAIQIARNAAIDAMRSRDRRERLVDALPPPRPASQPGLGAEISSALATLSPKLRDAVLLVEVAGFTYVDAGEALGVPVGTVKSRVFQARDQLAAWFEADEPAPVGRARRGAPRRPEPAGAGLDAADGEVGP